MKNSAGIARLSVKSDRSAGIYSNINKSVSFSRESRNLTGEKIENRSSRSQYSLLQEVTPGKKNASLLEHQLSLPCSKPNFQPIALFEEVNFEKSKPYVFEGRKSQSDQNSLHIENRDHNYSGVKMNYNMRSENRIGSPKTAQFHNYSFPASSQTEKSFNQITNINDLKKITPRVKLLNQDTPTLQPAKKVNPDTKKIEETVKSQLKKYCRTCAGVKLPLVDIFSEKGIQMKLNLQIQHLENISENDTLSTQMCMDCICDLKMSYTFFMQIKKAESKLKSIHSKLIETSKSANAKMKEDIAKYSNPPLIQHDPAFLKNNGPRISAVYSTKDSTNWETETGIPNLDSKTKVKSEPSDFKEDPSENESIEEFDPEDPPFNPDSEEDLDSDGEPKKVASPFKKTLKKLHQNFNSGGEIKNDLTRETNIDLTRETKIDLTRETDVLTRGMNVDLTRGINIDLRKETSTDLKKEKSINLIKETSIDLTKDKAYAYDKNVKAYVKMEMREEKETKIIEKVKEFEELSLKRKIQDMNENLKLKTVGKDAKIRKLNVNEALNIKTEENGVMYVTVRGAKPNELLLVKVKKMDKGDKSKVAKKFDTKEKENPFLDRNLEKKGQIIEDQIEQYKKKREKVLGPRAQELIPEVFEEEIRIKREVQIPEIEIQNTFDEIPEVLVPKEVPIPKQIKMKDFLEIKKEKLPEKIVEKSPKSVVSQKSKEKAKPVDVKVYNNPEDYNFRIETAKNKWEDKQRKDWEEAHPGVENPIDRLKRILGDAAEEENLQEFLENLQQRKMIISRLSDEDVVSLFQERIASKRSMLEELLLQGDPKEELKEEMPFVEFFECDFCFSGFPTKEVCDEHMKIHDMKIQHFCEDCNEEFPVLRLKKNHNVICIRKLICKYCDLMLDSKGKKKQHEQKHCDNLFGQICEYCGEKFKHQGTLDQHVKTKHLSLEKVFQCSKCPKKFALKTKLSFHLKSVHTSLRAFLCEDCGADFKNPASLRHHRIRKHLPTGNKRECPVCRKMIPCYSLSKHMHTHKAYTIKCPHCDKMFKNTSTLKQHVRIHEDQRQFRCDTCGVGFNRRDGLRLHMKVHQKSDSRGSKECSCQVCGEKFPNHSMLVIHRNRVHKDGRNFTCHICNRSMISTRSLEWHLAHIHNERLPGIVKTESVSGDSKRVSCFHCHKTFKTEMILRTHIKNSHMEKEPVKCLDCDETFLSEVRLRHHMMIAHNRLEGTLQCDHCPKRFVNQLRLKTHMIAHSEERPFKCDVCGFNLKTKIQLIKHHQNRHSDERPLQCRYCPWKCKQVSALVCHERTHTNERPYACSVCRQRFKYLGDKNKHERRHESLGGAGFKRIVSNRGPKKSRPRQEEEADTSNSDQMEDQMEEEMEDMEMEARLVDVAYEVEENVKNEGTVGNVDDENEYSNYQQDYEETSREASEAAEVILNMEDTTVYTEEVTAENIESIETTHVIEDEMMANQILQSGTVVHIEQQDEEGKIQMIPVVLSIPDLTEDNSEVNLATASIMYHNEEE